MLDIKILFVCKSNNSNSDIILKCNINNKKDKDYSCVAYPGWIDKAIMMVGWKDYFG